MFTKLEIAQMDAGHQPSELSIALKKADNRFPVGTLLLRKYYGKHVTLGVKYRVERNVAGAAAVLNDLGELRVITKLELALGHWRKS